MIPAAPPTAEADAWPSAAQAWLATTMLTLAYILSFLDRQAINLLAPAIKADLAISDVQLSLLQGTAFAIPFVTLGLLFGALADRTVRTRLVVFGVAVWSMMTSLCGAVRHFPALFACRAGVGIGEAVLNPAAVSLISDCFPPPARPRALAFYNMGTALGAALGYLVIAQLIPKLPVHLPLLGNLAPWRATFVALGIPGVLIAGLLLMLREPARRGLMQGASRPREHPGYRAALGFLLVRRGLFAPLFLGMAGLALLAYGPSSQTTLFFARTFHWSIRDVARVNGVLLLLTALPGTLFGGYLAARLRKQRRDGTLRAIACASTALILPAVVPWLLPSAWMVWMGLGLQNFCIASSINLGSAALADVTPNELRGKVVAVYSVVLTLLGLGLGPSVIAMITQYWLHDEGLLRYSLLIFSAVVAPLSALMLWTALPSFGRVVRESEAWSAARG